MAYFHIGVKETPPLSWVYIYLWINSTSDTSAGTRALRIWYGDTKIFDKYPASNQGGSYTIYPGDSHTMHVKFAGSGSAGSTTVYVDAFKNGGSTGQVYLNKIAVTTKVTNGYLLPSS